MPDRIELPVAEMVKRYRAGESTAALARAYGVCQHTAWRRLLAAGVTMRPRARLGKKNVRTHGGPLYTNRGYLVTLDREGKQWRVHRGCYEAYCGEIPRGYVVHHIDGDRLNNTIGNLSCMTQGEHMALHHRERGHILCQ